MRFSLGASGELKDALRFPERPCCAISTLALVESGLLSRDSVLTTEETAHAAATTPLSSRLPPPLAIVQTYCGVQKG